MKYEQIKFKDIQPSEYNPRKIKQADFKSLSKNLKEFGLVDPIIINLKNHHIIGGHQRYKVLHEKYVMEDSLNTTELNIIKLGDIGWVFETDDLKIKDDAHEKALNLALNKISGEWDYSRLSTLLTELSFTDLNTDLTGFNKFEIGKYTIPSELGLQFQEINDIEKGTRKPNENKNTNMESQTSMNTSSSENEDEDVLVTSEEIEEMFKHECPNCGYKW